METNVNYTIVGIFVITLVAAIIMGIIWLSAGFSFQIYKTYKIYMTESVSGLNVDSPVEYNGVNVGNVKSMQISQRNPRLVVLLIDVKRDTPITVTTKATLNVRGLTGISYLGLKDSGTNMTPLVAERGQEYPVIKTAPSLFLRLDTALTKLTESLQQMSVSIRNVLDDQNLREIKLTIQNLQRITNNLANNSQHISTILENTAKASLQFKPILNNFQMQTMPAANQTISNLDATINNLSQISTEIKQNPSILIRGKQPQPLGPGER
jgi:phospholipid/cholesterol/gamma-HCH transport system substrate-binding protein